MIETAQELSWNERTALAEVEGLYGAVDRLSAQVFPLKNTFLDRADEAHRITMAAYQEGAATLLQVLDAARTRAEARLTYYRAVLIQQQTAYDLAIAAGQEPDTALQSTARTAPSDGIDRNRGLQR
jgi:outer membrane protein TolC